MTVQALQTTFSLAGAGVSAACDSRVKGNVSALLASARPPIAVVSSDHGGLPQQPVKHQGL
ncbi:hypothetical protein LNO89_06645 [Klebsiella pneumoniae subsp. pneumoniae]|nr:hypothetical protein [Klebsiella pneumoniae subsp. pneumoniae]